MTLATISDPRPRTNAQARRELLLRNDAAPRMANIATTLLFGPLENCWRTALARSRRAGCYEPRTDSLKRTFRFIYANGAYAFSTRTALTDNLETGPNNKANGRATCGAGLVVGRA